MYIDSNRLTKYLDTFKIAPSPAGLFEANKWDGLNVPESPEVIYEGSIFAGQSARLIKATLNERAVVVMQWYERNVETYWYNVRVWELPENFDWSILLPDFDLETYDPVANHLVIALSDTLSLEVWAKLTKGMNSMDFDVRLVEASGLKTPRISLSMGESPRPNRAMMNYIYSYKEVPQEFSEYYNAKRSDYISLKLNEVQVETIKGFLMSECSRLRDEVLQAIESRKPLSERCLPILQMMISEASIMDSTGFASCYDLSPLTIAEMYRANMKEKQEREAVWDERETNGVVVVALRRCWECGRTQIMGELKRGGRIERMPKDQWQKAVNAQSVAHTNSLQTAQGEVISSVGFINTDSSFEFVVVDDDWYDGC